MRVCVNPYQYVIFEGKSFTWRGRCWVFKALTIRVHTHSSAVSTAVFRWTLVTLRGNGNLRAIFGNFRRAERMDMLKYYAA
jgi:hypothetical protein